LADSWLSGLASSLDPAATDGTTSLDWTPLKGPQTLALESEADVLGFGGAAGPGKSTLLLGLAVTGPTVARVGALGQQIASGGGQPTPEQASELQRLQARMLLVGRIGMVLLAVAVVTMAIARYL
jgi:hypothetical protein